MKSFWSGKEFNESELLSLNISGSQLHFTHNEKYRVIQFLSENEFNFNSNIYSVIGSLILSFVFAYFHNYTSMGLMWIYAISIYCPLLNYTILGKLSIKKYIKLRTFVRACVPLLVIFPILMEVL